MFYMYALYFVDTLIPFILTLLPKFKLHLFTLGRTTKSDTSWLISNAPYVVHTNSWGVGEAE